MLTRPDDLADSSLMDLLSDGWCISVSSVEYMPVGFGSHHWAVSGGDRRWFVTVDDLDAKRRRADEPRTPIHARLHAALATALTVAERGLSFVVAPVPTNDSGVLRRLDDRYAVAVYPYIEGTSHTWGDFETVDQRLAVLALIAQLHDFADLASTDAMVDDLVVPRVEDLLRLTDDLGRSWDSGPYGEPARALLARHAGGLERLLMHYERLARNISERPERMVLTHGEPHIGNTIVAGDNWLLVDWDTTLVAPPERDLWTVAGNDASALAAYTAMTGRPVLADVLDCYRLWWDLAEISGYIALLGDDHADSDDVRESWRNLNHYLDPVQRWPQFM